MDLDDIPTLDLDTADDLTKGEARGGKYYRRTPKPGGGWRYFYTEDEYKRAHGGQAHVSGHEAAAARERAKSGEVILSKKELLHRLKHGTYSIVSAGRNPAHPEEGKLPADHPSFAARHEELRSELQKRGMKYTEVEGHYGGKEKSFLVYHHEPTAPKNAAHDKAMMVHHDSPTEFSQIRDLGKKFNQDSVIHSHAGTHEMHYTEHHKGEGHKVLPHAEDFYTHAPTKRGATKFSLNFDFDTYHPGASAVHKSMRFVVPTSVLLMKSASHKYISRTPNRSGGYNYVYAHPETGEHVAIETKHKSAAKNAAGARTESHAGGKHVGIMLTHAESPYHDKGGKTESRTHDSLSVHERAMHDHALRDTHEEKTSGAAEKPTTHHEVSVSSMERYRGGAAEARRTGGSGTVTKFSIRDPNKPGGQEFHTYEGHGATPGERKTHALKQHAAKHGITDKIVHSANPRAKGSTPKAPEKASGESDAALASRLKSQREGYEAKAKHAGNMSAGVSHAIPGTHRDAAAAHREAAKLAPDEGTRASHERAATQHERHAARGEHAASESKRAYEMEKTAKTADDWNEVARQHGRAINAHLDAGAKDKADEHRRAQSAADTKLREMNKSFAHAGASREGEIDMLESTPHLRAQIKMVIAQEDPMAKGLYAFEPSYGKAQVNKIPDDYLLPYLDAFIEEAFEHEKRERSHDENGAIMGISQPTANGGGIGGDEADYWSQFVMNELVVYCGKNENLMRACTKANANKSYVAGRLRAMGLVKPAFNGGDINGDFMEGYMHSEEQTAAGIGKSLTADTGAFPSSDEMRKALDRTLSIPAEAPENVKLEDDGVNPVEMLANVHRARFGLMQDVYGIDLGIKR